MAMPKSSEGTMAPYTTVRRGKIGDASVDGSSLTRAIPRSSGRVHSRVHSRVHGQVHMVHNAVQDMNATRVPGQQSVRRAIEVLFCFGADAPALSAADVAARSGMNRTTAWRYLQTLAGTGLVREVGEGRFALGPRTVSLAEAYTSQWGDLEAVASAALVRLRDGVGETAALHLRQGWSRVVVRQVESRHELHRTYRELGEPISLL
ncbi:MAG TPA: helix-turn-helix domain-containing protein, partial [Nocardioidaceae bacterium]|nr:helix-turn-helix domain-containing protein [Nocardioidaceae bacterium]